MKPPEIVFLQGPPRCGKDTLAKIMWDRYDYMPEKFAAPIRDYLDKMWNTNPEWIDNIKNSPLTSLLPEAKSYKTVRDLMIAYSEDFMKPLFGKAVFGLLAVERVLDTPTVFSDSGFVEEAEPIIAKFGLENCVTIQVQRDGCSFTGDSRSYWTRPGLRTYRYTNFGRGLVDLEDSFTVFWNEFILGETLAKRTIENAN